MRTRAIARPTPAVYAAAVLLCACAVLLSACSEAAQHPPAASAAARVVSLHEVTTEIVIELGARALLVGAAEPTQPSPKLAAALDGVARASSLESVLRLQPSVVLGLSVVADDDPDLVRRLREAGVEVLIADPVTLDDVYALTRAIARSLGRMREAETLIAALQAQAAPEPSAAEAKARPRVFVYDCCDPPFTAGGKTVLSDLIARAGGQNVFADLDADWTHVSWEQVLTRHPDRIVIHDYAYDGQTDTAGKRAMLERFPELAQVPVTILPLGCSLGGLRSAEGLSLLRAALAGAP